MRRFATACAIALGALSGTLGIAGAAASGQSPNPFDQIVPLAQVGDPPPATRFVDQRGDDVRLADLRGDVVAIAFVYTRCQDACPIITHKFGQTLPMLDGQPVRLVEVTIDPAHDTQRVMAAYARHNGIIAPQWLALTGPPDAIEDFDRRMGVQSIATGPQQIIHNDRIVVVSADGRISDVIDGSSWTPSDLAAELRHDAGASASPLGRLDLALGAALAFCGGALRGRAGIGDMVASIAVLAALAGAFVWVMRRTSTG